MKYIFSRQGSISSQLNTFVFFADTMVHYCCLSFYSDFCIVSENAIKSTEVSLLDKYAILRTPKIRQFRDTNPYFPKPCS